MVRQMRTGRLPLLLLLASGVVGAAAIAACGARTGLDVPGAGAAAVPDGGGADAVTFEAGCPQQGNPWLLFDVFDSTASHPGGMYAMRADGGGGHPVTMPHSPSLYPSVSPDGTKILYATFQGGNAGEDGGID